MKPTIQASFSYSHLSESITEDTHFKSITILNTSAPKDVLESLFFNMANNNMEVSKEYITTSLNKCIATHFFNKDSEEDIEDHIIRHNNNFILFTFNPIDDSLSIKYLTHTDTIPGVITPEFIPVTNLREQSHFEAATDTTTVENSQKEKKTLFKNIFGAFKKKNKNNRVEA